MNIGSNGKMGAIIESISFMWDGIWWQSGINRGKYVSVRVSGSPEGLSDYIEGLKTGVWYEQFVVDGETYAYMENYDPSGRVIPLCQRVCRTCSAILW